MCSAATAPLAVPHLGAATGAPAAAALARLHQLAAELAAKYPHATPLPAATCRSGYTGRTVAPPSAGPQHDPATDPARWQGFI